MTDVPEPDLDRLALAVREDPDDGAAQQRLWDATFRLEQWWFAPRGAGGDQRPAAAYTDGQMMLFGFTSLVRCHEFALTNGLAVPDVEFDAIAVPPAAVVADADNIEASGVEALMMDHQVHGYFTPVTNLTLMWRLLYRVEPDPNAPPPP